MVSVPATQPKPFGLLRYPDPQPYVDVRDPDTWAVIDRVPASLPRPRWDVELIQYHPSLDHSMGTYYAFSVDDPEEVAGNGDAYPSDRWLLAEIKDNCYCPRLWAEVPF